MGSGASVCFHESTKLRMIQFGDSESDVHEAIINAVLCHCRDRIRERKLQVCVAKFPVEFSQDSIRAVAEDLGSSKFLCGESKVVVVNPAGVGRFRMTVEFTRTEEFLKKYLKRYLAGTVAMLSAPSIVDFLEESVSEQW